MAEIKIKIGASVDRGLENAFRPVEESAKRSRRNVKTELDAALKEQIRAQREADRQKAKSVSDADKAMAKSARDAAREREKAQREEVRASQKAEREKVRNAEKERRELDTWERNALREKAKARQDEVREYEKAERAKAAAEKQRLRESAAAQRQQLREEAKAFREAARAQKRVEKANRENDRNAREMLGQMGAGASHVVGAARKGFSMAKGVALDVAGGAGVDMSLSSHVGKNVELEKGAVDLSNAAYMPGKDGKAGKRQDPNDIIAQVRQVAHDSGTDANVAMSGLQKFVAKTGDLETGRAIIGDMAKLSRATGAELDDMADAAGDVASALGDVDNKGAKVNSVMRAIAAQGKEGAVEIKDLAVQMAKIGAAAGQFEGDQAENVAKMAAIAQASRQKGGAASATQAAQSTVGFMSIFSKQARRKAFGEMGVNITGEGGKIRDSRAIILDAITAASAKEHGGMKNFDVNMGKMFMDASSRRAVRGFETIYKESKGASHEEKLKDVADYYDNLAKAAMQETEVSESFKRSMQTTEAQAQMANNELRLMSQQIQNSVVPAMREFVPLVKMAGGGISTIGDMVTNALTPKNAQRDAEAYGKAHNSRMALEAAVGGRREEAHHVEGRRGWATHTLDAETLAEAKAAAVELAGREQAGKNELDEKKHTDKARSFKWYNPVGSAMASAVDSVSGAKEDRQSEMKQIEERNERMHAELLKMNTLLAKVGDGSLGVVVKNLPKEGLKPPGVSDDGTSSQTSPNK